MNLNCVRWGNGRELRRRQSIVPAKSFRFTKTFTERCWSNRRSRHKFFRIRQYGETQPDQRAAAVAALDGHLGRIAIEHLQTLGDVGHADASAPEAIG